MSLYRCEKCGCVENTALGRYWSKDSKDLWSDDNVGMALCSECAPTHFRNGDVYEEGGKWHGQFPKQPATGYLVDQDGHLWRTDEMLPRHFRIVGVMQADGSVAPIKKPAQAKATMTTVILNPDEPWPFPPFKP